ncbi:von Willebrand factor C and EGF domain-containing protein-like isoform X2 [Panulirus ornatus]|uniref:von Willebrand factor C and EGF domain-containing protein-like isoform X2 n=1 Tax=Panulirus ornatus TaxID=150431 RepID=UPI003A887975
MSLLLVLMFSLFTVSFGDIFYGIQHCVDETGQTRSEGETWTANGCRQCSCTRGNIICRQLHVRCYPRPHPHCVEIPGPCCPQWDCSMTGCTDQQGAPRNEGETWQDPIDPCTFCSCEHGMVTCFVRDCPPPPHVPCTRPPHPGQCCLDCNPSLSYYH